MPNNQDLDSRIRALTEQFIEELSSVVRETALAAVQGALDGDAAPAKRSTVTRKKAGKRGPGRPKGSKKRGRPSKVDSSAMLGPILAYVKANPGSAATDLAATLGCDTKDVRNPVQELLAQGKLRTEGQRRGTKYFAGSGSAPKAMPTKKKARRKAGKRKAA